MPDRGLATIDVSIDDHVATIWLNRPESNNGINLQLTSDLKSVTFDLEADPDVRVVVLRGRGKHFSVGGDIAMFTEAGDALPRKIKDVISNFHEALLSLRRSGKPSIALVHGACAGGGLSLALACDFVIAAQDAKLAIAYRKLGTSSDGGMTHLLTRMLGQRRALDLLLLSDNLTADDALRLGLVNRVSPAAQLGDELARMVATLRQNAPTSVRVLKTLAYSGPTLSFEQQLSAEVAGFVECAGTEDFREGVRAFTERRVPDFKGA